VLAGCSEVGEEGELAVYNPRGGARKLYKFDKVFGTDSTQEEVYEDTKALIRSVLDGQPYTPFLHHSQGPLDKQCVEPPDTLCTAQTATVPLLMKRYLCCWLRHALALRCPCYSIGCLDIMLGSDTGDQSQASDQP
jgi:hypothetical protein